MCIDGGNDNENENENCPQMTQMDTDGCPQADYFLVNSNLHQLDSN